MRPWLLIGLVASVGCRRPPDAPAELDELCKYLYTHMSDEEDDALAAGVVNLDTWLASRMSETSEGYTVENLDQATVNALDGEERDLTGLVGAAVGNDSAFTPKEVVDTIVLANQMEVSPGTYSEYNREWKEPSSSAPDCFPGHGCAYAQAENTSTAAYPLGLEVTSTNTAQYRWVETEVGWAMVHRTWLIEYVDNKDWVDLDSQFYMTVTIPRDDGTARRLQATWMVARLSEDMGVPENLALSMVVDSMQGIAEDIETYLGGGEPAE